MGQPALCGLYVDARRRQQHNGLQSRSWFSDKVQYDQLADRWVLTQFAVSATPYTQCVAVSTGPNPTGSYFRYAFSYSRNFNDYPKLGVWTEAYYITYNMFRNGSSFIGNQVCALERDKMLIGAVARQACASTGNSQ